MIDMEHLPFVSVIVPVYNMEKYLPETLDSILASDYHLFEVVLMNDGSTDASLDIAREYASKDARVSVYTQRNAGPCAARNHAISLAKGEWILPVDADNRIECDFISKAVEVIKADKEVKVVCPRADFFGDRSGEWKLPPFSLRLLARKNIMDTCALYRKSEWKRIGGYCEEIIAREDWEFWIAMLKEGGKVVRLPGISLHYRIRNNSKRVWDRLLKRHVVDVLNKRHPEFFERELGGPLRYARSWSRCMNWVYRFFHPRTVCVSADYHDLRLWVATLPVRFRYEEGSVLYKGRNELREISCKGLDCVVKSFRKPNLINRIAYGLFRSSKAQRSYEYAEKLQKAGIGTPEPIGYYTEHSGLLFGRSYYISLKSECNYTYHDLIKKTFPNQERILRAIARTTARMHEQGFLHKDYSRGNILFKDMGEEVKVDIIDLNRIRFRKIGMEAGCKNFERLPGTPEMYAILGEEYAKARGYDIDECIRLIRKNAQVEAKDFHGVKVD